MKGVLTVDKCSILNLIQIEKFYLLKALGYSAVTTIYVQLEFNNGREKYPDSYDNFSALMKSGEISKFPLEIEDLVEMSQIQQSKRASDAELSCFVVAKRIGGKVLTDDKKAIKYIRRYIEMPTSSIVQLVDILIEAYFDSHLGDYDLRSIQNTLADHKFIITIDLANEAARRKWMKQVSS